MPCYYCDEPFVDKDLAVPLPLVQADSQDQGGVLFREHDTVYVHQQCLGDPTNA